jgi:phosphatidylserine/phosphatidylglycerophosphate/cardiolipin synthase-like enzyme
MFLNESEVLISSMNLTNFAKDNNHEIGCLISDSNTSQGIVEEIIFGKILKNKEIEHKEGIFADLLKKQIKGPDTTESP